MLIHIRDADLQQYRAQVEAGLAGDEIVWTDPKADADLRGVEVFITPRFTAADAASADRLRLVQVAGAGLDNIALDAIPSGTACANLYRHEAAIAEYVVTASAFMRRGFLVQDRALRRGLWLRPTGGNGLPIPGALSSATVGFLGFGHIGTACWRLFRAFGVTQAMAVSGSGAADRDLDGLAWWGDTSRLDELFEQCDIVVASLPDSSSTRGLVRAAHLERLGPDGILVNVGRGAVVEPNDLYEALASHRLGGAAIDVWYNYPADNAPRLPADRDFGGLDNIIMTPHISGVSRETYRDRIGDLIENVNRVRDGRAVFNQVK